MAINIEELNPETKARLKLTKINVPYRVVVLGKLLQALEGLTTRDALWALRTAHSHTRGFRKVKTKVIS